MENLGLRSSAEANEGQQSVVFKEAMQMIAQAMALLQQEMHRQMNDAMRLQEVRMQEALHHQARDSSERIRKLEEAMQLRERRDAEAQSEEGSEAAGGSLPFLQKRSSWREPVAQLEARSKKLEDSVERAVESVFPRVALLVSHLEAKAETSPLRGTAGLAASTTVKPSTTTTVTSASSSASTTSSLSNSSSTSKAPSTSSSIASASRSLPPTNSLPSLVASFQPPTCSTPTNQRRSEDLAKNLFRAAGTNNLEDTRRLLDAGANPNCVYAVGMTPLMNAALEGHASVVALLLQRGADVHRREADGWTALHFAAKDDREGESTRLLLDAGAQVDALGNDGCTALLVASEWGNKTAVRVLLEAVSDPNCADATGETPLMVAVLNPSVVALLLQSGADLHLRDSFGRSALHYAAEGDREGESVRLLLDAGAQVDALNNNGSTALHFAAAVGNEAAVRVLLEGGASKHIANNKQKTPLQLAKTDAIRRLLQ